MLAQAARETGGIAIQNRGTLGGNIANASPAADSPPALLAYGAEIELVSSAGHAARAVRRLPHGLQADRRRRPAELVSHIIVPRARPRPTTTARSGPRRAQAISKVCFAGCVERRDGSVTAIRIALGGVAPVPVRAIDAEQAIVARESLSQVQRALDAAIAPIDDVRSSARYRRRVADNLLGEFLAHVGLAS